MDFSEAISGLGRTLTSGDEDFPVPVTNQKITDGDRVAMRVLKEQGATITELSELFGFSPQAVRTSISKIQGAELDAIRQVVGAEMFALNRLAAKNYLMALLTRNPNRLHIGKDGEEIPGAYVVADDALMKVVEKATAAMAQVAGAAGLDKGMEGGGSLMASWVGNSEAFRRLTEGLDMDSRLKLRLTQSVELESGPESSEESSGAVSADFEVEGDPSPSELEPESPEGS